MLELVKIYNNKQLIKRLSEYQKNTPMLNKSKHQLVMRQVLEGIYRDISLAGSLGFKGGTAAMLFYDLPRFSVDLDFDLLVENADEKTWENLREKIKSIMAELGDVKKADIKRYTVFLLLSYGDEDHNVKIEISKRKPAFLTKDFFELQGSFRDFHTSSQARLYVCL